MTMTGNLPHISHYFYSIFKDDFIEYLEYRASCGYTSNSSELQLVRFDRFCFDRNITLHEVTKALYTEWITEICQNVGPSTKYSYIRKFNNFCKYLTDHEIYAYHENYVHNASMFGHYTPHIYSLVEIRKFKQATMKAIELMPNSQVAKMFPMIFILLYGCGLRIGEALSITKDDIDIESKIIRIIDGKGGVSRLLPLSNATMESLCKFIDAFHPDGIKQFLFCNKTNKRHIDTANCYCHFRKVLILANIPHLGKGKGPRLHDFRHTFAVTSLRMFLKKGVKTRVAIVYLSRYLGHSSPEMTEYYIHLCPECIPAMQKHIDKIAKELFGDTK